MDRQLHQIQHDASPQSMHQATATQLNAEVALESNNKLVLKRDSIDFISYQSHTPTKVTVTQHTKAPTPITAQAETSPSLDDLDYYEPAPAIQIALASGGGGGGGANTTPTTPNAIAYCSQQHHVNTTASQSDYYSSPEAVESPLAAGSLSNGCSGGGGGGGGAQTRGSWPVASSALQTAAHQMASAASALAGSQSPQSVAQSSQTGHLVGLGQTSQLHNQFQNHTNNQYASLQHHSQIQAYHQHAQQQVSPPGQSISPYQTSYGTSPALANGYAPGHHHQPPLPQPHHQQHQHQLQQSHHHQPPHQPIPLAPQSMSLEAQQYGDVAQTMTNRLLHPTKHSHQLHNHTIQHHQPNHQHTSQHHHHLPQHHHQLHHHSYTSMPLAHSNSHHQLDPVNQQNHQQHYGNTHQQLHYMNHHHHNNSHQTTHLNSPPGVPVGPPDQSHEPIYQVQHLQQQQHPNQHMTPGGYYQPKGHNHHQNQPQQQHHHHHTQHHYQQYQNSQQLFRSSTMLTPPRVEPISMRPNQLATPPRLDNSNNLIRANSITTSPRSDNNINRSSSKKAESPLNQLHLQCANLLDEHQQQQQRISNILLKDGIDLSANNDNNISTTATTTTTTPTNVAGANTAPATTATTSAKTSTTSTTSTTSNGDSNLNNDNNISTTATTTTTGNSNNSANNSNGNNNNGGRSKRLRTSFKHNQLKEMKRYFATNQNPDANNLKTLAQTTGLSKRVLQVWFQNARAKHRRNTARLANQQLFNVVNQHTMLPRHHHQQDHLQTYQHLDTQHHQPIN